MSSPSAQASSSSLTPTRSGTLTRGILVLKVGSSSIVDEATDLLALR